MSGARARAFAPATVANVAVGFDILGFACGPLGDTVTVTRIPERTERVAQVSGPADIAGQIPTDSARNTATAALRSMREALQLDFGFEISIEKGIPLASGMGGSAASAVAAVVAANALLPEPLPKPQLLGHALAGEAVASGSIHGDNVAPCLLGGLVLVRSVSPVDVVALPVPEEVVCVLAHPDALVDTRSARAILRPEVSLRSFVGQTGNLAAFVAACYRSDLELLGRALVDGVIEPQRASLVPAFAGVKRAALDAGALGCSISGAGPSIFALARGMTAARKVEGAMRAAFAAAGVVAELWVTGVDPVGARIVEAGNG